MYRLGTFHFRPGGHPPNPLPACFQIPGPASGAKLLSFWYKILAFTPPLRHNLAMATNANQLQSPVSVIKPRGQVLTIRLPQGIHERLKNLAVQDERSLSAQVRWVLKRYSDYPAAFDEQ